jgi:hypothetical protein
MKAFERIKAALCLSDDDTTKMLKIWKNMKPVEDWEGFVTDGRLLALRHLRGIVQESSTRGMRPQDDFDLEKCLLLQAPGNLCPHKYLMFD